MKRSGSFLAESLQNIKRLEPDITKTIEIVDDSVVLNSPSNSPILSEDSKPRHCLLRGALVNYDITRIPSYNEGIGSPTKIICSHASVPTTGKSILRSEYQSPIHPTKHSNINNNTNIIQKEINDFNKIADDINNSTYYNEIYGKYQNVDSLSFSMDSNRYKTLDWLVSICMSFQLSTECEIISICLFHNYLKQYTTKLNYQLVASVCISHSAHLLHLHPPSPTQFYDLSLHSWRESDWSEVEDHVKLLPIPCCYPLLLQQLHSITISKVCLFSSLYCLESILIEGSNEEMKIQNVCQRCIEYGMKKNGMEEDCPFKMEKFETEKIPENLLCHQVTVLNEERNHRIDITK